MIFMSDKVMSESRQGCDRVEIFSLGTQNLILSRYRLPVTPGYLKEKPCGPGLGGGVSCSKTCLVGLLIRLNFHGKNCTSPF